MTNIYIAVLMGACQIFLSIHLIVGRKNKSAVFSEIASSLLLFCIFDRFVFNINNIVLEFVWLTLFEYLIVKLFLIFFIWLARVYSFYAIKSMCSKRRKIGKGKLKILNKFNKVSYWPRIKLGSPARAGKIHSKTKVKFDAKGFPKFKSYYTVRLRRKDWRKNREHHFYIANKMIHKELLSNYRLRAKFSRSEIKAFSNGETPGKYTWHHHQDKGVLQLVEYSVHSKTPHIGGYSIWGE